MIALSKTVIGTVGGTALAGIAVTTVLLTGGTHSQTPTPAPAQSQVAAVASVATSGVTSPARAVQPRDLIASPVTSSASATATTTSPAPVASPTPADTTQAPVATSSAAPAPPPQGEPGTTDAGGVLRPPAPGPSSAPPSAGPNPTPCEVPGGVQPSYCPKG